MELLPLQYEGQIKAVDKFPSVCLNYEQSEWADMYLFVFMSNLKPIFKGHKSSVPVKVGYFGGNETQG